MSFTCKYCGREFTSERTTSMYTCGNERRFVDMTGYTRDWHLELTQKFYEINIYKTQRQKHTKTLLQANITQAL